MEKNEDDEVGVMLSHSICFLECGL